MGSNPVILVHGILGQRHLYWNLFKRRLRDDGFRYHDSILPYGLLGDMRIAARFLRDQVDAARRRYEAAHVDLVCHSAGGLAARYYLSFLGGAKHVDRLVTMGTPHQGTYFSYLFGPPVNRIAQVARQSRPGSDFLKEISGRDGIEGVDVYNIWSPVDGVVVPASRHEFPGARSIRMPMVTHWGYLWRRDVYETVVDCLRRGRDEEE